MIMERQILQTNSRKVRYETYDFANISASEGVYGIHQYPAMLHFKLVESLIEEFSRKENIIYDPFCGSGVTLNVAIRMGRFAIGTDINPLAILIAKVRSFVEVEPEKYLSKLEKYWDSLPSDIPNVRNINYWFKDYVIKDLGKIRSFLLDIPESKEKDFLLVVFSQTVRNVSLTRKGEFKRYRMKKKDIDRFNPDVLKEFMTIAIDFLKRLRSSEKPINKLKVLSHDVREPLPFNEKVDLVITSPPYGDSKTTVAYGEFFSFSLEWMDGLINVPNKNLDKVSLGGTKIKSKLPSLYTLEKTIEKINQRDKKRADEVKSFFIDLYNSIGNIVKKLSDSATVCFVVGNRKVKRCTIPMDEIVKDMFEDFGLQHYETRIRKISNKRLPMENSPSNIKGDTDSTMNWEYVVIMKT